jgi:hypothetical protein
MAKLYILIFSIFICSCSVEYHINKAIKKGFKCDETGDTIRITTLDSIPVIINDTIYWEKVLNTKDTIIKYKTIYRPKTRLEKRIEYKIKIKTIYKDRVVEKAEARAEGKKAKNELKLNRPKGNLNLLFVGVAIGLLLSFLWKYAKKTII